MEGEIMSEEKTLQDKKVVLTDDSSFILQEYQNLDKNSILLKIKSIKFEDVTKAFTSDNTATVKIFNEYGEEVGEYQDLVVGGRIILDVDNNAIELTLQSKDLANTVADLKSLVQTLQEEIQELKSTQSISEDNQDVIIEYLAEEIGGEDENTEV